MTIIQCPDCDAKLKAKTSSARRKVKCPKCGSIFQVGGDEEALAELDAAEEEAPPRKTMARSGRRQRPDDDNDQESPRKSHRQQDDDDDDQEKPRSRRRQADDEEDGDDDEAPRRGATVQLWLGVGSLSLAALVLLAVWIPAFSSLALPAAGFALALGMIGLVLAIITGVGHGFPIAGCEVSGIALVVSVLWIVILPDVRRDLDQARAQARPIPNRERAADFAGLGQNPFGEGNPQHGVGEPLQGAPTRPAGTLTLARGTAQLNGELADSDPTDRFLQESPCKVYTLSMTAGRTYQIDMTSTQFDAYLRLEDPEGRNVAMDDDGGGDLNARIRFTCPRDGRYRIVATTLDDIGSFTLRVQER